MFTVALYTRVDPAVLPVGVTLCGQNTGWGSNEGGLLVGSVAGRGTCVVLIQDQRPWEEQCTGWGGNSISALGLQASHMGCIPIQAYTHAIVETATCSSQGSRARIKAGVTS